MRQSALVVFVMATLLVPPGVRARQTPPTPSAPERHLANIRQLTDGGENAEAYFSFDGERLSFQSTRDGYACDRIYTMRTDALDRFGTRLEHRFTRAEIQEMMEAAGLKDIVFSEREPFWVACGVRGG